MKYVREYDELLLRLEHYENGDERMNFDDIFAAVDDDQARIDAWLDKWYSSVEEKLKTWCGDAIRSAIARNSTQAVETQVNVSSNAWSSDLPEHSEAFLQLLARSMKNKLGAGWQTRLDHKPTKIVATWEAPASVIDQIKARIK